VSPNFRGSHDAYLFWPRKVLRVPLSEEEQEVDSWEADNDEILGSGVYTQDGMEVIS
jgi:hypothetical protein